MTSIRSKSSLLIVAASSLCWLLPVQAEVVRSSESGFVVEHEVNVPLPPPAAWAALTDIGKWWDPEHSYSGDARNITLDPIVGGCFCEKLGMYAGAQHMTVVYSQPPKLLRLAGGLGPLQQFAVTGSMTWTIEIAGGGSHIKMHYIVGGYADRPLSEWAPLVDSVLATQVQRLGRFITSGNPAESKSESRVEPKPAARAEPKSESKAVRKPVK